MTFSEMEAPSMRIVGGPWKDGPHGGVWSALRLDPWRVMVQTSEDLAAGRWLTLLRPGRGTRLTAGAPIADARVGRTEQERAH